MTSTPLPLVRIKDILSHWLCTQFNINNQYASALVGTIHRIFGSEYIRTFYADSDRFFALITHISTEYVNIDMSSAVMLAYEYECKTLSTSKPVPILTMEGCTYD